MTSSYIYVSIYIGLQPNVERYMRDNNRQTIEKLGFVGFGKNE